MRQVLASWRSRFKRGHLISRLAGRGRRELQSLLTGLSLGAMPPRRGFAAIATLNPDEENASVTAAMLVNGLDPLTPAGRAATERLGASAGSPLDVDAGSRRILLVSPDPVLAREAVKAVGARLGLPVDLTRVRFLPLRFWTLLRAYRDASVTFSTHVLLPGIDRSGRRTHVHLTHGSGPKPDTTFRGPANILASITPEWVPSQLREYRLPAHTPVVSAMPRLEVMRLAAADRSILARLGVEPGQRLLVWAPTYRMVRRSGGETRVSGIPFGSNQPEEILSPSPDASVDAVLSLSSLVAEASSHNWKLVVKVHPHDADSFPDTGVPVFTNADLMGRDVTPYQLFGVADLLITDYSSVFTERAALNLPFALWRPDYEEFADSYRGFRKPPFRGSSSIPVLGTRADLGALLEHLGRTREDPSPI